MSIFLFLLDIIACVCTDKNYPVHLKEIDSMKRKRTMTGEDEGDMSKYTEFAL